MEIGTHYNGHFCDDNLPGGNQWNTADWNNELDQFFTFMTDWKTLNGYTDAPDLQVPTDSIKGGRTPCLTGHSGCADPGVEGAQHDVRLVDAGAEERHLLAGAGRRDLGVLHAAGLLAGLRGHDDRDGLQLLGQVQRRQGGAGHRAGTARHRQEDLRVHVGPGLQRQPGADPDRQPLQQVERRLVQPGGDGLHEGQVQPAGHLLRDLPGRHRLDGTAGSRRCSPQLQAQAPVAGTAP